MESAAHRILHLLLAALGLAAAAATAHLSASHAGPLVYQVLLGGAAYAAATGLIGRFLRAHPADAIADSITALAVTAAGVLALTAAVLTGIGHLIADHTTPDTDPAPADPAADPYAKTA